MRTGLEPATPGVTGRYSNQLNYRTNCSVLCVFLKRGCKDTHFFFTSKLFSNFFSATIKFSHKYIKGVAHKDFFTTFVMQFRIIQIYIIND